MCIVRVSSDPAGVAATFMQALAVHPQAFAAGACSLQFGPAPHLVAF